MRPPTEMLANSGPSQVLKGSGSRPRHRPGKIVSAFSRGGMLLPQKQTFSATYSAITAYSAITGRSIFNA